MNLLYEPVSTDKIICNKNSVFVSSKQYSVM